MLRKLNELKELHAKTSQGEWITTCANDCPSLYTTYHKDKYGIESNEGFAIFYPQGMCNKSDAEFITEAHKYLPRLIEALEKCIEQRDVLISDYGLRNNLSIIDIKENIDKELEQILEGYEWGYE